jgi:hypothetical protein
VGGGEFHRCQPSEPMDALDPIPRPRTIESQVHFAFLRHFSSAVATHIRALSAAPCLRFLSGEGHNRSWHHGAGKHRAHGVGLPRMRRRPPDHQARTEA